MLANTLSNVNEWDLIVKCNQKNLTDPTLLTSRSKQRDFTIRSSEVFLTWGCTSACFSGGQVLSLSRSRSLSRFRSRSRSLSLSRSRSRSRSRLRCRLLWWDEDLTGLCITIWSCWASLGTWHTDQNTTPVNAGIYEQLPPLQTKVHP